MLKTVKEGEFSIESVLLTDCVMYPVVRSVSVSVSVYDVQYQANHFH